eukprot:TRINITY_DN9895_c0_g2_i1.p1 TRINITY_DN9895_c0_g2~~TRINITY_DN9895_c0_g2_i1.p1  ORF type:complete len:140 (-),score=3.81 TRINITY_DN9895_c0_g2_i1:107-526(-)
MFSFLRLMTLMILLSICRYFSPISSSKDLTPRSRWIPAICAFSLPISANYSHPPNTYSVQQLSEFVTGLNHQMRVLCKRLQRRCLSILIVRLLALSRLRMLNKLRVSFQVTAFVFGAVGLRVAQHFEAFFEGFAYRVGS